MSYTDAQKGLLPVVLVPCAILLFALYRYVKRPLFGNRGFEKRMDYFYSYVSAALLGEFLFQALPNATIPMMIVNTNATNITDVTPAVGSSIPSMFIMIGFFIMLTMQRYFRVWHDNPYFVTAENNSAEIHHVVDPESQETREYFEANLSFGDDSGISDQRVILNNETAELQKRRRLACITIFIMSVLCVLEGFFLVYQQGPRWVIVVVFVLDKLMETLVIAVVMCNAYFHATSERQYNWYLIGSAIWCVVVILSTMPAVCDMTLGEATTVVSHIATGIFYALAGGFLFYIAFFYTSIHLRKTDGTETLVRQVIFAITAAVSWTIGFFY